MNKFVAFVIAIVFPIISYAKENIEMASLMHDNGKIYVVVGVLTIIFVGIVIYLISIDKKVSKLQKQVDNK